MPTSSKRCSTLKELLAKGADGTGALGAPGRSDMTFGALRRLIDATMQALNSFGIGRGDRVGIVLPNGPEMATAFVGVASCATSAPLNQIGRASCRERDEVR